MLVVWFLLDLLASVNTHNVPLVSHYLRLYLHQFSALNWSSSLIHSSPLIFFLTSTSSAKKVSGVEIMAYFTYQLWSSTAARTLRAPGNTALCRHTHKHVNMHKHTQSTQPSIFAQLTLHACFKDTQVKVTLHAKTVPIHFLCSLTRNKATHSTLSNIESAL